METKKILVVDDQAEMLRIHKQLLAFEGYEVLEANEGHLAIDLLVTQKNIDLILLDIYMPRVDGVILFEAIKEYSSEIMVIVTSVFSVEDQKRMIPDADDYYDKSEGVVALLSKIKEIFKKEKVNS